MLSLCAGRAVSYSVVEWVSRKGKAWKSQQLGGMYRVGVFTVGVVCKLTETMSEHVG